MNELDGLSALLIEPHSGMRANIHGMLTMCGLTRIDHASSANQAVKQLGIKAFDLVLCEYDLEGGQDGQQLLEDLRHHRLISLATMFFMVTAEGDHGKVISAAELAPTDYILKPFTADRLLERIARALDKRNVFLPVYRLMEAGAQHEAIQGCIEGEAAYPRHAVDFLRLRAELHLFLGEAHLAEPIYRRLADSRTVAWARLGLARTLYLRERYEEAGALLTGLVEDSPRFVDAYDWLARAHGALGELDKAQAVLARAVAVSPHAVRRLRTLGETAFAAGDDDTAEKMLRQVVSKAKYSEFRDPEDHVKLVRTLVRKGDPVAAASVIRDLERSMGGKSHADACGAMASALLHEYTGNDERLMQSLNAALAASRELPAMSAELKLELARSCLAHDLEEGAAGLVRDVMRNAADAGAVERALRVMAQAGHAELGTLLAREAHQHVVDLVAGGAERAKNGDYHGAVALMSEAAVAMPGNPQVAFNAALALLRCLEHTGWDERLGQQALVQLAAVRRLDPRNPKLAALAALHQAVLKKYNKGARARKAG